MSHYLNTMPISIYTHPTRIVLEGAEIDNARFEQVLTKHCDAQYVSLVDTAVDEDGLMPLLTVKQLRLLQLESKADSVSRLMIGQNGLNTISQLIDLNVLLMVGCTFDLQSQPALVVPKTCLHLPRSNCDDAFFRKLTVSLSLSSLLSLQSCPITDECMATIARQSMLTSLRLDDTNISDASVGVLEKMTTLIRLGLSGTRISDPAKEHLRHFLPNTQIT